MQQLTKDRQNAAREFILRHARPLEKALSRYYFEEGAKEAIWQKLGQFQNPDGGFGQALEPDLRAPESSALATAIALEMLRELQAPAGHRLVKQAITYLLETYDRTQGVWRIIPPTTDASPHAPWWNQDGLEQTFEHFRSNPRPELAGYLFMYESLVPSDFKNQLLQSVLAHVETLPDNISGDALLCYLRLAATENLPDERREQLCAKLRRMIAASVETNPEKWRGYCLKPLWAITSPASPFRTLISDALEKNLDYEIETQCADGSWQPNWTWGGAYPTAWNLAEREWRGILTLRTLKTLKNFGRLQS